MVFIRWKDRAFPKGKRDGVCKGIVALTAELKGLYIAQYCWGRKLAEAV